MRMRGGWGMVLAMDVGERRVGLALGDPRTGVAFPLQVLERRDFEADAEAVRRLAEEYGVKEMVVGLPLLLDGREGSQARAARDYGARMAERLSLPVTFWDERFSTREAERRGARDSRADAVAASLILESYLARKRETAAGRAAPGEGVKR